MGNVVKTIMIRVKPISDDKIIQALKKNRGMVFLAAEALGCDADVIIDRAKRVRRLRAAIDFEHGRNANIAELKLHQAIQNGNSWAIKHAIRKDRISRLYRG